MRELKFGDVVEWDAIGVARWIVIDPRLNSQTGVWIGKPEDMALYHRGQISPIRVFVGDPDNPTRLLTENEE